MLCQFARQFPPLVAEFLERARQFKRRLREESVTDLMMVNLQNPGIRPYMHSLTRLFCPLDTPLEFPDLRMLETT
jgi:hypothetical protein